MAAVFGVAVLCGAPKMENEVGKAGELVPIRGLAAAAAAAVDDVFPEVNDASYSGLSSVPTRTGERVRGSGAGNGGIRAAKAAGEAGAGRAHPSSSSS